MKKLLIIIVLVSYSFIGFTQEQDSVDFTFRKNVVKILPINIPFQSVSLEFERMIDPNYSLTLGIGLPIQGMMIDKYGSGNSSLKKPEFNSMHVRAALRYYYGDHMLPKGFYVEPYLKYQQINGSAAYEVVENINSIHKGDMVAKFNTLNLGVQFGVQFLIAKRVTVDLYFLGLEGGLANGNITTTSEKIADADNIEVALKDAVAELPFYVRNWVSVKKTNNQVFIDAKDLQYPWFRGGISVGIAF